LGRRDEDSLREAGELPKGPTRRTARVGGLVTGRGLRWAGMRTANRVRTRRVLVSEYVEGERFEAVRRANEVQRDRDGEIVCRLYFGLLYRDRIALGDPHPGHYLLCPDGRVCFLDFGLLRGVDAARVAAERAIALAVRDGDPEALKAALRAGGYLPASRADAVDADFRAEPDANDDHVVRGPRRAPLLARRRPRSRS
jgi:hypothetical protein